MILFNIALIQWLSKKQHKIETTLFGTKFVAMKHGMKTLQCFRYRLQMMYVSISGTSFIYGDTLSDIHNTQRPGSTFENINNAVLYPTIW